MIVLASVVGWHAFFFYLFAAVTCAFALAVLFSNNIVHMAFYLIVSLGSSAGLFILAGAEFLGAMQLMIYVGGTFVLLIFGVMLTAQERFVSMTTRGGEWVMAAIVGGALLVLLVQTAFSIEDWTTPRANIEHLAVHESKSAAPIGLALLGVRTDRADDQAGQAGDNLSRGRSGYLLLFEVVSVHLVVVLIGAAYLARTKRFAASRRFPALRE
jgi:NADH-quinone oxidoreductase subunit J